MQLAVNSIFSLSFKYDLKNTAFSIICTKKPNYIYTFFKKQ